MNNLFVIHTQYNMVLACGLCRTVYSKDTNDIVVFKDFSITYKHQKCLETVFNRILLLDGNVPKMEMNSYEKYRRINNDNEEIERFINVKYNRVFIVLDMCIQEMYVMKCVRLMNGKTEINWLEDGATAYYRTGVVSGGMGADPIKRFIRKLFFTLRFGLYGVYDLKMDPGMHKQIKKLCVIYPEYVLRVYNEKQKEEISDISFFEGMTAVYEGSSYEFPENSLVIAMDLMKNYGEKKDTVIRKIQEYIHCYGIQPDKVFVKYHPRENEAIQEFARYNELDSTIGIEQYLTNSTTKQLTLLGVMSTALLTGKKMGYNVVSLAGSVGLDNTEMTDFYKKIGIVNY